MADSPTVLLLCYGNPSRLDDGLGIAFASGISNIAPPHVDIEVDYQLSIEDAATLANYSAVVFVDAAASGESPFFFRRVAPRSTPISFSDHSVSPEQVIALASQLFSATTRSYALGIRGYVFCDFGDTLSPEASDNLSVAVDFLSSLLQQDDFCVAADAIATEPVAYGA